MAKLVASSQFNFQSIKENGGTPQISGGGASVTATFPNKLVYTLTAAENSSLSFIGDSLQGQVGTWSGAFKGKSYFTLTGISYDMDASTVYDDGYSDGGITVYKLAAELAINLNGDDEIIGSNFNDKLAGYAGNDLINGGKGKDFIVGGTGSDLFQFTHVGVRDADNVTDFSTGVDKIQLDTSVFTQLPGELNASILIESTAPKALEADDRLLFDTASGKLYYDADGNGSGKALLIAKLTGVQDIDINDFVFTDLSA